MMDDDPLDPPLERSSLKAQPATTEADTYEPSNTKDDAPRDTSVALPTPRASSPQRRWRRASLISLLLLLIAALFLIPDQNRAALLRTLSFPTAAPDAPIQSGNDTFLWEHAVPWGRLLIDGKPGPALVGAGLSDDPVPQTHAPFRLPRGRHTLEYDAALFPTLRCTVSVPYSPDDTCPLGTEGVPPGPDRLARLLDLQATVNRLSTHERQALVATAQERLTALAAGLPLGSLMVGDHYRDATGQVTQASTAMQLAAQFPLDNNPNRFGGLACVTICAMTSVVDPVSTTDWILTVAVKLTWRYTTTDGGTILADGSAGEGDASSQPIPLQARWSAGDWQIDLPTAGAGQADPITCPTGAFYRTGLTLPDSAFVWTIGATLPEQGCLFAGSVIDRTTGRPSGPLGLVLYRAGVLLAVNGQAHTWFPTLPLASAHERALANAVAPTTIPTALAR
jgi:hypothetical protein